MAKKIVTEDVYKTNDDLAKKQIIRQNLINRIISMQEKELEMGTDMSSSHEAIS